MFNEKYINQEFLLAEIAKLETGYVDTAVNLLKGPVFIDCTAKAMVDMDVAGEDYKAHAKLLKDHEKNQEVNTEMLENLETILDKVYSLKK